MPQVIGEYNGRPVTQKQYDQIRAREAAREKARKEQEAAAAKAARTQPRANTSRTGARLAVGSVIADRAAEISRAGQSYGVGWCLKFVRTTAGAPGGTNDATQAWGKAQYKHTDGSVPPRGSIVFWTGGSKGHGHVAISDGNGNVWSTDAKRPGKVDLVSIADLTRKWGSLNYEGWAEDVNGKRIGHFGGTTAGKDNSSSLAQLKKNATKGGSKGSGSGSGTGAPPSGGVEMQDNWDREDFEAAITSTGFGGALIKSDKELRALFARAIRDEWSPERFAGEVRNTHWYRNRSDSQRDFDTKRRNDPATWAAELDTKKQQVRSLARSMGISISDGRLNAIATTAYRNGFDGDQLTRAVASEFDYDPRKSYSGAAGSTLSQIREAAAAYGQNPGRYTEDYVTKVLRGEQSLEGLQNSFKDAAKRQYSHLAKELDAGQTLEQLADPYRQKAAEVLELDPDTLGLNDRTIQQGLIVKDGKGGASTMPLWQYEEMLRNDERWLKTNNARDSVMSMGHQLLTSFGLAV